MKTHRRRNLQTLTRRRDHLAERLESAPSTMVLDYDRAELRALNYALRILEAAEAAGELTGLEAAAGYTPAVPAPGREPESSAGREHSS